MKLVIALFVGLGIIIVAGSVIAEIPQMINYQGKLSDAQGAPGRVK